MNAIVTRGYLLNRGSVVTAGYLVASETAHRYWKLPSKRLTLDRSETQLTFHKDTDVDLVFDEEL